MMRRVLYTIPAFLIFLSSSAGISSLPGVNAVLSDVRKAHSRLWSEDGRIRPVKSQIDTANDLLSYADTISEDIKPAGIMFYNVENLFDVRDDSLTNDNEFLPDSPRRWTRYRMDEKCRNLSRVILNAGAWNPPVLVGLCEVENAWILGRLLYNTGLNNTGYKSVHYDSPDERGIDVALLYLTSRFEVLESRPVSVGLLDDGSPTRDILYVKGIVDNYDTLHVFVNHWPSRYGGAEASRPRRLQAAQVLTAVVDSVRNTYPLANIVLMGDFNEDHDSDFFRDNLATGGLDEDTPLYAPALGLESGLGTLKYRYQWQVFDQIIVSRGLLAPSSRLCLKDPVMSIVRLPFLLEQDDRYGGQKPFRTYVGMRYQGGYSDHLPVMIYLEKCK